MFLINTFTTKSYEIVTLFNNDNELTMTMIKVLAVAKGASLVAVDDLYGKFFTGSSRKTSCINRWSNPDCRCKTAERYFTKSLHKLIS